MIKVSEIYDSKAIAVHVKNDPSNAIPYLGEAFFPNERKASIDLKWIKTANGLPVSLAPSNFDAKATIRARKGFGINKQEMAFFREAMTLDEHDRIELAKLSDCTSPFVKDIVNHIYNDTDTLILGADVVPERMRFQLLFPEDAGPSIYISADDVTYKYDYDPDGTWATNNRKTLSGPKLWANTKTAQPLEDIREIVENADEPIKYLIMSKAELLLAGACDSVKEAILSQNTTAHVTITATVIKNIIETTFPDVTVITYTKKYKDEAGSTHRFVPDGKIAFLPEGNLGKTWFGMTPEELAQMEAQDVDITILPSGVAVAVQTSYDTRMETTTTVAETLLPSYEHMDSVYLLCTGTIDDGGTGDIEELTVTSAAGTASGDTKITVAEELEEGHSYKVKVASSVNLPEYGAFVRNYTTWDGESDVSAATGKEILVIECDENYLAVKAGKATVTAHA